MTFPVVTAAAAARYATQAFAEIASAERSAIAPEDAQALAVEMKELLLNAERALRILQGSAPASAAGQLGEAKQAAGHAAHCIGRAYFPTSEPTAAQDGYSRITDAAEIETIPHGVELVVDGTVYKVSRMDNSKTFVRDLQGTAFMHPATFLETFAGTPVYRRH